MCGAPENSATWWLGPECMVAKSGVIATRSPPPPPAARHRGAGALAGRTVRRGPRLRRDARPGAIRVEVDPRYLRPTEVDRLTGDASKAREVLGWVRSVTFAGIVSEMVKADLDAVVWDRCRSGAGA